MTRRERNASNAQDTPEATTGQSLGDLLADMKPGAVSSLAELFSSVPGSAIADLLRRRRSERQPRPAHRPNKNTPVEQFVVVETLKDKGFKGASLAEAIEALQRRALPSGTRITSGDNYLRGARNYSGSQLSASEIEELSSRPIVQLAMDYPPAEKRKKLPDR